VEIRRYGTGLDQVRSEIDFMRGQLGRQPKGILQLQRAGISTASAELFRTETVGGNTLLECTTSSGGSATIAELVGTQYSLAMLEAYHCLVV